jgi:uncharacterized protein (TIGR03000 family)
MFSFAGLLLLAVAAVVATPNHGQAQHGGGHGGGGHGGGGHFGGGRSGGHFGGYRGSYYRGGYHNYYGYRPYYGYRHHYGYYPYYDSYPYYSLNSGSGSADSGTYGAVAPAYSDGYSPNGTSTGSYAAYHSPVVIPDTAPVQSDNTAHVTVNVPADAEVWFEGTKTTSTGSVREYESPPLTQGNRYTYEIRARWHENGREVNQTQQVEVTAGAHVNVDFPLPPKTVRQASTAAKS